MFRDWGTHFFPFWGEWGTQKQLKNDLPLFFKVLVFQLKVCYKVDRLLTGLIAQQKGTIARWYSNKTSLINQVFLERRSRL